VARATIGVERRYMMKNLQIGVIGVGRIGKLHCENLVYSVPNAKVTAVADPCMTEEIRQWAEDLGITNCYKEADRIINDPSIDAVFICSATDTHADFIIQAAKANKHIMCEKPIHTDLNKIKEALAEAEKAGVKLFVGFVRRFDHNHKKVADTVAKGLLGDPHIVKVTSRDPEEPPMSYVESSGGIFVDMMIHDFDMARYLSGSEITEVTAYGTVKINEDFKKYGDVDTATVMLKFENGALGLIDNSRAARYGYDQRTEVHCGKGCVQVQNDLTTTASISTAEGVTADKPTWFFLERYNQAFITEAKAFIDAVLNDTACPVDGEDGLKSVVAAIAAKKSLDEGRSVKISEIL